MSYTPVVGELIWDTSTNSLYIGNGITPGGLPAGTLVTEDVQDITAAMLINGTHQNITFTYNDTTGRINSTFDLSTFNGTLTADGFIGSHYANDSTLLLNALTGAVNLNGTVKGHVIPSTNIAYDLGSASYRFRDLYLSGSSIKLGSATITSTGSTVNLPAGSTINGVVIGTGSGAGVEAGMNYNINIVGDDSTLIVNARTKSISVASLSVVNPVTLPGGSTIAGTPIVTTGSVVNLGAGSTLAGTVFGFRVSGEDSTLVSINNGDLLQFRGDNGIQVSSQTGKIINISADITAVRPSLRNDSTPAYVTFVGATGAPSYIGTDTTLRYFANTGVLEVGGMSSTTLTTNTINIGANSTLTDGKIFITRNTFSAAYGDGFTFAQHYSSTADATDFAFYRTRGTGTAPTSVLSGDDIADITFLAYDGTTRITCGGISATVEGAPSGSQIPMKLSLLTNNGVARAVRAELSAAGIWKVDTVQALTANTALSFGGMAKLATYADQTAANAAVGGTPTNGMMYYDTALSKIRGYQGGAWVNFA
jgi:hypothetical protein